jgi:FkbM family methyltransferase
MLLEHYRTLLRLPQFKGKSRIVQLYRSLFFSSYRFRGNYDFVMDLDPIDWTQSDIVRDGGIEPLTSALYGKLLRLGDKYVDVGAHIGFHTLVARHLIGENGLVIAVEPQPYNCEKLLANWRANGFDNVALYVAAVGEHDSTVALHQQVETDSSRLSICLESVNDENRIFYVPIRRLETILREQRVEHVRLLKIDVEGYELEVVNGLGAFLPAIDNIILEVLDTASGISAKSVSLIEKLKSLEYELRTVEGVPWDYRSPLPENNLWASRNN